MEKNHSPIPVVILAGGQSNRLQIGNKLKWQLPFNSVHSSDSNQNQDNFIDNSKNIFSDKKMASHSICRSQTLLSFIIERLKIQTNCIVINGPFIANNELKKYKLPIISDQLPDFQGPLSGILTALHWAREQGIPWIATVSCDTPFFPENLLQILSTSMLNGHRDIKKRAAIAIYKERTHPTFGLWSVELYELLKQAIEVDNSRGLNRWALQYAKTVEFKEPHKFKESPDVKELTQFKESTTRTKMIDPFFNINTLDDYKEALSHLTQ